MKNSFIDLTGKLPRGMAELYVAVAGQAASIGASYLVVGAMARDLVLVHGYGSTIERGTRDVDFGIEVQSWDVFHALRDSLLAAGFTAHPRVLHKLNFESSDEMPWEIDIVPFGAIEDEASTIRWPPGNDREMCVLGFSEALKSALQVQISAAPDVVIPVASPEGICLLKLIAWLDRTSDKRGKDALDIAYLVQSYPRIPEIYDALYDEGCMEAQEWVEEKASAIKLGRDVAQIMSARTLTFLEDRLLSSQEHIEVLAREMSGSSQTALAANLEILQILFNELRGLR